MTLGLFAWNSLGNIMETAFFTYFFCRKLGCAPGQRGRMWAGGAIVAGTRVAMSALGVPSLAAAGIMAVILLACVLYAFDGSTSHKVFWGCVGLLVPAVSMGVLSRFSFLLPGSEDAALGSLTASAILGAEIYLMLEVLLFALLLRVRAKRVRLSRPMFTAMMALMALGVIACGLLTRVFIAEGASEDMRNAVVVASLALFALMTGLACMFDLTGDYIQRAVNMRSELNAISMALRHTQETAEKIQQMREFKHNFLNHMMLLNHFAREGDLENLKDYLNEMGAEMENIGEFISTGHPVVDAIVYDKRSKARILGIHTRMAMDIPPTLPISDVALSSALSNLLDNAIEACAPLPRDAAHGAPYIVMSASAKGGMLEIVIRNSSNGVYRYEDGLLATTKAVDRPGEHGIGLSSVRRVIRLAHGFMTVDPGGDYFEVRIHMPTVDAETMGAPAPEALPRGEALAPAPRPPEPRCPEPMRPALQGFQKGSPQPHNIQG